MLIRLFVSCVVWLSCAVVLGEDWLQFRGSHGNGIGVGKNPPMQWSDDSGLAWKVELPGPGASSPIVVGDRIFLTYSTGFGPGIRGGSMKDLKRHLACYERGTGKVLWSRAVSAELPEQEQIREDHGYASSTPVSDGERVYVFWGKSGVYAFDLDGKQLWQRGVGSELNGWGSATSPVVSGDKVLVNASVESGDLVALKRETGEVAWRAEGMSESWHAPSVVTTAAGGKEVVMALSKKVYGVDLDTGKRLWECDTGIYWYMCPTPVVDQDVVYLVGGRGPTVAMAIRSGGRGNVNDSHVLWKMPKGTNVPSPVLRDGHLYFAHENLGILLCVNARTGKLVYEERLKARVDQIYASPILVDGKLYYFGRGGRCVVVEASPNFKVLAENTLENGRGMFNSTPAWDGERLLVRSNRMLYSIGGK